MNLTKVLIVTSEFPPQPGGIGNHAHNLAAYLCKHPYDVTVVADVRSDKGEEELIFDAGLNYNVRRIKRMSPIFLTYFKRILVTYSLLKTHDMLLVSGKFPIWLGGAMSLFFDKKLLAVVHGSEIARNHKITNYALKRFDRIIAVSNYTKSLLPTDLQKNSVVIPNGFDLSKNSLKREHKPNSIRIITVGNVTQRKGQHNVIRALPKLLNEYPELKYDIVGIPTEKESLILLAERLGVSESIVFHGKVSESEKINLLHEASIFIMLSEPTNQGDVEGFGIAILEANALGVPAIGSRGCGIEDAISPNFSGVLVSHTSIMEIESAMATILNNYNKFSNNAVQWSQKFSWDAIIIKYLALFKL